MNDVLLSFMKLFLPFKFQCGDTFCTMPGQICNRDREFTFCEESNLGHYTVPNFAEKILQFCQNITEKSTLTEQLLMNDSKAWLYVSIFFNVLLLVVVIAFVILHVRQILKNRKTSIERDENYEEKEQLTTLQTEENNIFRSENPIVSNPQEERNKNKLLPSTNHNSYDIENNGYSCCPTPGSV